MNEDEIIVVNETEYTGAGKLPSAQLTFAKQNNIEVKKGDPIKEDKPGERIVIPESPLQIGYIEIPIMQLKESYINQLFKRLNKTEFTRKEIEFIAEDIRESVGTVQKIDRKTKGIIFLCEVLFMKERPDDFIERSEKLQHMTDEELNKYFWELAERVVEPLVELAQTHTSPSIERSVLLRMGFNSLQAKALVERITQERLLSKGAGNVVYQLARLKKILISCKQAKN